MIFPSVVQFSKQNSHWTFDVINNFTHPCTTFLIDGRAQGRRQRVPLPFWERVAAADGTAGQRGHGQGSQSSFMNSLFTNYMHSHTDKHHLDHLSVLILAPWHSGVRIHIYLTIPYSYKHHLHFYQRRSTTQVYGLTIVVVVLLLLWFVQSKADQPLKRKAWQLFRSWAALQKLAIVRPSRQ